MTDSREEDDDFFIYGIPTGTFAGQAREVIEPTTVTTAEDDSGAVASTYEPEAEVEVEVEAEEREEQQQEEEEDQEEDEDSDIEIILDPEERHKAMTRDFRQQGNRQTYDGHLPASSGTPAPHLTTEYTPTPRGEVLVSKNIAQPPPLSHGLPIQTAPTLSVPQPEARTSTPDQDTSLLPPVTAPPSHPIINPSEPGVVDGRSIFEVDMDALSDKPWRRPGTDISDYFNYGFDEISWEAYCYRRRDMTEMVNHLKGAVTNFAGLPEDQITALPPEVRAMVMAGATALMSGGAMPHTGPQLIGVPAPGGMMNPHDMGMMGVMTGGDMQPMQTAAMMPGNVADGEMMNLPGMAQEGFQQNGPLGGGGAGQIMSMPQDFTIQDPGVMGLFPQNMDSSGTGSGGPGSTQSPPIPGSGNALSSAPTGPVTRSGLVPPFRGRGAPITSMPLRGRGTFPRGRGRGGTFGGGENGPTPIPVRPASPLPPGVPTGPRNQNRYKDRDGNAPAVEGLDYGGGMQNGGDMDDRAVRKRRVSPPVDDGRALKRR